MSSRLHALFLAASLTALSAPAVAAANPPNACIDVKNTAAAKLFACLVKVENRILRGQGAESTRCSATFQKRCTKAEERGGCPMPPVLCTTIEQRVEDAAGNVLAVLQPVPPQTDDATRCVVAKNKTVGEYVSCTAKRIHQAFRDGPFKLSSPPCVEGLSTAFSRAEARGACLTTDDALVVGALGLPAATNLAGADLRRAILFQANLNGANLRDADVSDAKVLSTELSDADLAAANFSGTQILGVDLSRANLTGGSFTNATLGLVLWFQSTCPDGSRSDTNGSQPESCCGYFAANAPAECSP